MQKGRKELIKWMRSLGINVSLIEELGKGVIVCEILSMIHSDFPSGFLKNPNGENEYLKNMKICQVFLDGKNVRLYFPIEKLVKCKMQDNLELAQWLSKYYHSNEFKDKRYSVSSEEDERYRSMTSSTIEAFTISSQGYGTSTNESNNEVRVDVEKKNDEIEKRVFKKKTGGEDKVVEIQNIQMESKEQIIHELSSEVEEQREKIKHMVSNEERLLKEISKIRCELGGFYGENAKSLLMTFEKERDFYFKKLFAIEKYFLSKKDGDEKVRKDILEILYEEPAQEFEKY